MGANPKGGVLLKLPLAGMPAFLLAPTLALLSEGNLLGDKDTTRMDLVQTSGERHNPFVDHFCQSGRLSELC